ncbi:peptidylprolyl isomerase [Sphingomonas sp. A2-49]|uniref:peptidylprolyl isomerase n=1 Tax=Sphingomonas sp. A2-49 TaxID=1391375 RepID=UPI0021CF4506|nr:peptidylprolyl isomerase [Sphingomonas sp. A2-49]MCU6454714.1 peptidylprolyl isomerase [Sphingomonas sp. A2-49]
MRLSHIASFAALALASGPAAVAAPADPPIVRVRLDTPYGPIVLALEARRAPKTVANFMGYVDDRRFDGMSFYRSARNRSAPTYGFIQGGIRTDARRILPPFPLETTAMTGIRHVDGTISMARRAEAGSAGGNFFITVGPMPSMDARGGYPGYAAFGHVVSGMPVIKRILALPTGGGMGGQLLLRPIRLIAARRLNGTPRPTGLVKPWLVKTKPAAPPARK